MEEIENKEIRTTETFKAAIRQIWKAWTAAEHIIHKRAL